MKHLLGSRLAHEVYVTLLVWLTFKVQFKYFVPLKLIIQRICICWKPEASYCSRPFMRIHILHILWLVFFFNMLCSFVYCRVLNDINSVSGYTKESPCPHDFGGGGDITKSAVLRLEWWEGWPEGRVPGTFLGWVLYQVCSCIWKYLAWTP